MNPTSARPVALMDDLMEAALRRGQVVRLRAQSFSMVPAIRPGDALEARREGVVVGDIVLARMNGFWVTHRVTSRRPGEIELQGDAGGLPRWFAEQDVLARVTVIRQDAHSYLHRLRSVLSRLVRRGPLRRQSQ